MRLWQQPLSALGLPFVLALAGAAAAQEASPPDADTLARELANPVASLISVPLQLNWDDGLGARDEGDRLLLNIQPVIPVSLNARWNLISRTILPVIDQSDVVPGTGSQSGIGDVVQSLFFSPKEPTARGWIWGAGAVLLLPTATDGLLGADQWGLGPPPSCSSRRRPAPPSAPSSTTSPRLRETTTAAT